MCVCASIGLRILRRRFSSSFDTPAHRHTYSRACARTHTHITWRRRIPQVPSAFTIKIAVNFTLALTMAFTLALAMTLTVTDILRLRLARCRLDCWLGWGVDVFQL